jgi:two-component system, chemotaxis family, chemotaxis protein CheY
MPPQIEAREGPNPTPAGDTPHILVVDDDIVHRMVICRIAAKAGYVAAEAGSYEEAEQLLRDRAFACISLDLSLGKRGGIDVMQLIAASAPQTPVIIISGSDVGIRAEAVDFAHRLGLDSCDPLPKPVNLGELRQRLTQIRLRTDAGLRAST